MTLPIIRPDKIIQTEMINFLRKLKSPQIIKQSLTKNGITFQTFSAGTKNLKKGLTNAKRMKSYSILEKFSNENL